MPVPAIPGVPPFATHEDLVNSVTKIRGELVNLLLNLDTLNVVSLNAEVIEAGTITGDKIAADAVTAEKIQVSELSAISADLGEIDAGKVTGVEIYGSYIATANGTYPRSEMDVLGNYFAALASATSFVKISPVEFGAPAIRFDDGSVQATMRTFSGVDFYFSISSNQDMRLEAAGNVELVCDSVFVPSWEDLFDSSSGDSLQTALDAKAGAFSGYTGSVAAGTSTMHFTNGILTSVT